MKDITQFIGADWVCLFVFFSRFTDGSLVDPSETSFADITFSQNQQGVTTTPTVLDIACDLGPVDVALCTADESNYLCFFVRHQNETASFRDDNIVNNVQCMDMAVNKICHPGNTN